MGYIEPTPIQLRAIPLIMAGNDVIGSAQTGTGKTAAFALPILSLLGQHETASRALVLEPTRELAAQVETAIHDFARFTNLRTAVLYGGVGYGKQMDDLRAGADIIIATPGRLLDHMERGACRLDHVKYLVLDEADRMLDMGFLPDVRRIVQKIPRDRHTSLFSATDSAGDCDADSMGDAQSADRRDRRAPLPGGNRRTRHLSRRRNAENRAAVAIARALQIRLGHRFLPHQTSRRPDRPSAQTQQARRGRAAFQPHPARTRGGLARFPTGRYEVLVATDIASRGLDIADVSHVINYDVPQHPEDYIHRIGRTGRAEQTGDAFTLMVAADATHVYAIERFIGKKIPRVKLENFDYQYTALFEEEKAGPEAVLPRQSPRRPRARRLFFRPRAPALRRHGHGCSFVPSAGALAGGAFVGPLGGASGRSAFRV